MMSVDVGLKSMPAPARWCRRAARRSSDRLPPPCPAALFDRLDARAVDPNFCAPPGAPGSPYAGWSWAL